MNEELRVKTRLGEIIAYPNADPGCPGITIMYKPNGEEYEVDLFYVESQELNGTSLDDRENLHCYVYSDVYTEDYTNKFLININESKKALNWEG